MQRIRAAESALNITANNELHIQMMSSLWGSGDPTEYLTDNYFAAYDDHRYIKWDTSVTVSQESYISTSCNDDLSGNTPSIVSEWSLSVPDDVQDTAGLLRKVVCGAGHCLREAGWLAVLVLEVGVG